eukprot:Seg1487.3 transcript_id=Seg1487.3/GoldUCD/mRNA.D3Y31 product="hypothetical protein" protein_id=Seg1487.3/GoldUCD/D3Y31
MAAVGAPGCGKSIPAIAAIALTGSYPKLVFTNCSSLSKKHTKCLASMSTQGICLDDPTDPREIAEVSKMFFDARKGQVLSSSPAGVKDPKSCAVVTFNEHVLSWLKKKNNTRSA